MHTRLSLALLLSALTLAVGCSAPAPQAPAPQAPAPQAPAPQAPAPQAPAPQVSPYLAVAVQVEDSSRWFDRVSFKDVGLGLSTQGARDEVVETLVGGLSAALDGAHSIHAAELADPAWHRSCQARHVYVDLWRARAPSRVGFSLWRGCGAEDQFGWQEIAVPEGALDAPAGMTGVAAVGQAIAHALAACGPATC